MKMFRKILIVNLLTAIFAGALLAQKPSEAMRLFDEGKFADAAEINRQLLKKKPTDGVTNYRLARCLVGLGQNDEAIEYLRIAGENDFTKAYALLGDLLFDDYRFAEAAEAYTQWIEQGEMDSTIRCNYAMRLRRSNLGAQMLQHVEDIALIDSVLLSKKDFFAAFSLPCETGRLYATENGFFAYEAGRNDRRITTQNSGGRTDLYISNNLMGEWSAPQPLSSVLNSDGNENFPFVAGDGVTIYFGSEGHEGLGGYDIFVARYNSDRADFTLPQNVGMPFNSTANDYLLAIDEIAGIGWFATDRACQSDSVAIYRFVPNLQRTILRDKSDDYLRDAARLRIHRTAAAPQFEDSISHKMPRTVGTQFVVNDTTIYSSASDFVSDEARADYTQLQAMRLRLAQMQFTLQAKRELWQLSDTEAERNDLAAEIIATERNMQMTRMAIRECEKRIRNEENSVLVD